MMHIKSKAPSALAAPLALVALITLAACAGQDQSLLPQSAASAASSSEQSAPELTTTTMEDALIAFAQCLREQGVDVEDPTPGEGLKFAGVDFDAMEAAQRKCGHLMDNVSGPDGARPREMDEETKEKMLAVSACMRENGFPDFADPEFGTGGRISVKLEGKPGEGNPEQMMETMASCQQQVGIEGPHGGPATPGAAPYGVTSGSAPVGFGQRLSGN